MSTHISWIKKSITWLLFTLTLVGLSTYAVTLYFSLPLSLQWGSFPISFWGGGNDFAGALIISSQTAVNKTITFSADSTVLTCKRQIHWYYFNAARGIGLLPLSDASTASIPGVSVNGWLYTSCSSGVFLYDLVGAINYSYNGWVDMGSVYFWVQTNPSDNSSNGRYQPGAIAWKVTNGVNGSFFDNMFGIGNITTAPNDWGIGSVSNLIGTFSNIYIQWQANIGQSVETNEREILSVNLAWTRTILTNNDEANASKVINSANKNSVKNCSRYIWVGDLSSPSATASNTICIELSANSTFVLDYSRFNTLKNKDVVIKWGNVFLDRSIYNKTNSREQLSLYITDGYLIFDSNISSSDLTNIDNNGFKTSGAWVTKGVYLEGNFIVNGLILGSSSSTFSNATVTTIPFKTYIHGKLAALNTMTSVSSQRASHLINLLSNREPNYATLAASGWNSYFTDNTWTASLWDVFSWHCDDTNTWAVEGLNNGAWARPQGVFDQNTIDAVVATNCPIWHRFPLVITDKRIPSAFFNQ